MNAPPTAAAETARSPYLALLRDVLLGCFSPHRELLPVPPEQLRGHEELLRALDTNGWSAAEVSVEEPEWVDDGVVWPRHALTMIGRRRLANIEHCISDVLANDVPGRPDRDGCLARRRHDLMRAVLDGHGARDRRVWVADSFAGLPRTTRPTTPRTAASSRCTCTRSSPSPLEQVKANFARLGLLDDQVVFLEGWFKDTLPALHEQRWSVIRLDGDLYESTIQALTHLYPTLSPGGWLIVDDYGAIEACRQAVHDYRDEHGITEPIQPVDQAAVCWQRAR